MGYTHIAAVMSGNFVQRGEPAVMSKWARTECALHCGADLVLELPLPWALSAAGNFALGGVGILHSLGCVDGIVFGCESGDTNQLISAARLRETDQFKAALREETSKGRSYAAAAAAAAVKMSSRNEQDIFTCPNNILAMEYISAAFRLGAELDITAISRRQAEHDEYHDELPIGRSIVSASYLRKLMRDGKDIGSFVPLKAADIIQKEIDKGAAPASIKMIKRALLAALRCLKADDFARLPEVSEGLENRIYSAVKNAVTYDGLIMAIKSKRYTHARIRRILMSAFIGVDNRFFDTVPPYIRVLGQNRRGYDILRAARDTAKVPIIMKAADVGSLDDESRALFSLESRADDLWSLAAPCIQPCGSNMTNGVVIIGKQQDNQ